MQGPHWTAQGIEHLRIAFLLYAGVYGALGIRRNWLIPGATLAILAGVAASGQLAGLAAVLVVLLVCRVLGEWAGQTGVVAVACGLAILQATIAATVWIPVHTSIVHGAVLGGCLWAGRKSVIPWISFWRLPGLDWRSYMALFPLGFVLICHGLAALLPEVSSDGLTMHLTILESVRMSHAWSFDVTRFSWAVMPMGGDWSLLPAFLLGGEAGARLMNFSILALTVVLLAEVCWEWSRPGALLLAGLFASTPLVLLVTGSLFTENTWALFLTAGMVAAARDRAVAAALLLGAACATKYGSWLPAGAIMVYLTVRQRGAARFWAVFALCAAPPYLSAWVRTGNPVFPFFNGIFQSPLFATAGSFLEARFQEPIRWDFLYRVTVHSHLFFEGLDGALGFQYLIGLPLSLLFVRRWRRVDALSALVVIGIVAGLATSQRNLRYLYPALPAATLLIGCAWRESGGERWVAGFAVAILGANLAYLSNSGWHHRDFGPWPWQRAEVQLYRERESPARTLTEYLNEHHAGEGVIYLASGQRAGLRAPSFVHSWHHYPFHARALACRNGADWKMLSSSVQAHWVVGHADGEQRPPEREFLRDYGRPVLLAGNLRLFAIER